MGEVTERNLAKARKKAARGRVWMTFGCILLFFNAFGNLAVFVFAVVFALLPEQEGLLETLRQGVVNAWGDPMTVSHYIFAPFIAVFLLLSGIGGLSWIRKKGPLMSFAPMMAMISLVLIVVNLFLDLRELIRSNWDWLYFILNLIDLQLTCGIYFFGWLAAKGDPDDD